MIKPKLLTVLAPVGGALVPLEQVPDPVFSQKMLGEGITIDPTEGLIRAPFDGKIINMNSCLHAFVLEQNGVELLVHVGLDTVRLQGEGFSSFVKVGDSVTAGQPILQFDLLKLCTLLSTPFVLCVVTAPAHVQVQMTDREIVKAGQPLFDVLLTPTTPAPSASSQTYTACATFCVTNKPGLHARPAGVLARLAGSYPYEVFLCKGNQCVNAKSIVGVMGLALHHQDHVTLRVNGPEEAAHAFLQQMEQAFCSGFGEGTSSQPAPKNKPKEAPCD